MGSVGSFAWYGVWVHICSAVSGLVRRALLLRAFMYSVSTALKTKHGIPFTDLGAYAQRIVLGENDGRPWHRFTLLLILYFELPVFVCLISFPCFIISLFLSL
jgi:hypothetical protein